MILSYKLCMIIEYENAHLFISKMYFFIPFEIVYTIENKSIRIFK